VKDMALISVIIPAYNAVLTIKETIESVQKQTFTDWEIIVINDGSTDGTPEIIQSIKDERLKIFNYKNGGLPVARNRGILHASGEFIAFLDADDLWAVDKLEMQLKALQQHPEAGVAYSWTCFMDVNEQGEPVAYLPSSQYSFTGNVYQNLLVSDFIHSGSNTLIRKEAINSVGEFDPMLKSCEDWDYWLRLATHWDFIVVPEYQIFYRRTPGAMSSKVEVMKEACLIAMEKAYQAAPPELQYLKKYTMSSFHVYCSSLYIQHRDDKFAVSQAQEHLLAAIRLNQKILLEKTTQKLLIKFLLKKIFPPQVTNYVLQLTKQRISLSVPRLEA